MRSRDAVAYDTASFAAPELHHLAQIHHADAVADVFNHRKIVRDEKIGQTKLGLQIFQQVEHLRLDRDIERETGSSATTKVGFERPMRARCRCAGAGHR